MPSERPTCPQCSGAGSYLDEVGDLRRCTACNPRPVMGRPVTTASGLPKVYPRWAVAPEHVQAIADEAQARSREEERRVSPSEVIGDIIETWRRA